MYTQFNDTIIDKNGKTKNVLIVVDEYTPEYPPRWGSDYCDPGDPDDVEFSVFTEDGEDISDYFWDHIPQEEQDRIYEKALEKAREVYWRGVG